MKIYYGNGKTKYGTGVQIDLTGEDVANAIHTYLVAHDIHINGPSTVRVNGDLCENGSVYVDPSGFVISNGEKMDGNKQKEFIDVVNQKFQFLF